MSVSETLNAVKSLATMSTARPMAKRASPVPRSMRTAAYAAASGNRVTVSNSATVIGSAVMRWASRLVTPW